MLKYKEWSLKRLKPGDKLLCKEGNEIYVKTGKIYKIVRITEAGRYVVINEEGGESGVAHRQGNWRPFAYTFSQRIK